MRSLRWTVRLVSSTLRSARSCSSAGATSSTPGPSSMLPSSRSPPSKCARLAVDGRQLHQLRWIGGKGTAGFPAMLLCSMGKLVIARSWTWLAGRGETVCRCSSCTDRPQEAQHDLSGFCMLMASLMRKCACATQPQPEQKVSMCHLCTGAIFYLQHGNLDLPPVMPCTLQGVRCALQVHQRGRGAEHAADDAVLLLQPPHHRGPHGYRHGPLRGPGPQAGGRPCSLGGDRDGSR